MKIFISHSTKDKWAARRISEDLEKLGASTFLDEKDIRTGQSIDESIKKNLKSSDDFLLLISPSSVKSDWVLVELGGAIALEKNIIPILLYVGVNEIPQVVNLKLARDINDIDRYYSEVSVALTGKKTRPTRKSTASGLRIAKYKEGDKVVVIATPQGDLYSEHGLIMDWEEGMNKYAGKKALITSVMNNATYTIDIARAEGRGAYVWAEEWLEK